MKKIAIAGLLAVGLMAVSQQQASAWVNSKFGIGLNWHTQSAGNNFLWGMYKNGQVPGPEMFGGGGGGGGGGGFAPQPFYAPMPQSSHHHAYQVPMSEPSYAAQYSSPFQFANYPRPVYYYPAPTYYYYYAR